MAGAYAGHWYQMVNTYVSLKGCGELIYTDNNLERRANNAGTKLVRGKSLSATAHIDKGDNQWSVQSIIKRIHNSHR